MGPATCSRPSSPAGTWRPDSSRTLTRADGTGEAPSPAVASRTSTMWPTSVAPSASSIVTWNDVLKRRASPSGRCSPADSASRTEPKSPGSLARSASIAYIRGTVHSTVGRCFLIAVRIAGTSAGPGRSTA